MSFSEQMSAKHPSVSRNYYLDATNLLEEGVTISGATVSAAPPGLTLGDPAIQSPSNTAVKVRASGGEDGTSYNLTFTLTLSDEGTEVAIMVIPVSAQGTY